MLYTNYVIISLPKYTYQNDKQENKSSFIKARKAFIFLKRLFLDKEFIYNTFYFLMAFLGIYWKNYLFFTAHLLEIVRRSETLINVINAFWYPKKQILVTLILFLMVEYIFTIFVFTYYGDDALDQQGNKFCDYFVRCYLTIIDNTFKLPNGLMNLLSSQGYEQNFYLGGRFWLDNIFAIIVVMLILQMLAGIIVDNFSALRERQQIVNEDKFNICFICGLHKNKLNKLYSNEDGFSEHIKLDHYYWNYLFLIMNILRKEEKDLNEIDSEIKTNYSNQSFVWIPNERYYLFKGRCEKLDEEKKRVL
jgi:inositol 1,4,5-triphosphate receptor type 1